MNDERALVWPRSNSGTEPQHLLLTLLGDYWHERTELLPSSALVALLAEFDVTEPSARQAMRRLAVRGMLEQEKAGRATYYGIPSRIHEAQASRQRRALSFGENYVDWDGFWTVVVTSIPEPDRVVRHQLRNRLRAMRFGLYYDAVWISPHNRVEQASDLLDELGVTDGGVMRAELLPRKSQDSPFAQVFGLDEIAEEYRAFVARHRKEAARLRRSGPPEPGESLRIRTSLMSEWLSFRTIDPELPMELLPQDWPRPAARALFVEIYDALGSVAEARFREIIGRVDPALAEMARHHTSADSR